MAGSQTWFKYVVLLPIYILHPLFSNCLLLNRDSSHLMYLGRNPTKASHMWYILYIYTHIHIHTCRCIHKHTHTHRCVYLHVNVHTHGCAHVTRYFLSHPWNVEWCVVQEAFGLRCVCPLLSHCRHTHNIHNTFETRCVCECVCVCVSHTKHISGTPAECLTIQSWHWLELVKTP